MKEYRITKYDPRLRDPRGAFTGDDWSSVSQIGKSFGGVTLTDEEYKRVEQAYIDVALAFLNESSITALKIDGLENSRHQPLTFRDGSVVHHEQLAEVMRSLLRDRCWCRLQAEGSFILAGTITCTSECLTVALPQSEKPLTLACTSRNLYRPITTTSIPDTTFPLKSDLWPNQLRTGTPLGR